MLKFELKVKKCISRFSRFSWKSNRTWKCLKSMKIVQSGRFLHVFACNFGCLIIWNGVWAPWSTNRGSFFHFFLKESDLCRESTGWPVLNGTPRYILRLWPRVLQFFVLLKSCHQNLGSFLQVHLYLTQLQQILWKILRFWKYR